MSDAASDTKVYTAAQEKGQGGVESGATDRCGFIQVLPRNRFRLNGSSDQFKADFDWLVKKSENTDKVFRGYYSRSAQEKQDYEHIMKGKETTTKAPAVDDFYR